MIIHKFHMGRIFFVFSGYALLNLALQDDRDIFASLHFGGHRQTLPICYKSAKKNIKISKSQKKITIF